MAYGSILTDTVQSSTALTAPVFSDGNGTQIGQLCKAWVNFNGTAGTTRANFNMSSFTKSATGNYIVSFSNALTDANYTAIVTADNNATMASWGYSRVISTATTSCTIYAATTAGAAMDQQLACLGVFR